jgi:hypothetical protein
MLDKRCNREQCLPRRVRLVRFELDRCMDVEHAWLKKSFRGMAGSIETLDEHVDFHGRLLASSLKHVKLKSIA